MGLFFGFVGVEWLGEVGGFQTGNGMGTDAVEGYFGRFVGYSRTIQVCVLERWEYNSGMRGVAFAGSTCILSESLASLMQGSDCLWIRIRY